MNTSNAGLLGAMCTPTTAEASASNASTQTSVNTSESGEFKQIIDQSIGDALTEVSGEHSWTFGAAGAVAEPKPIRLETTSAEAPVEEGEANAEFLTATPLAESVRVSELFRPRIVASIELSGSEKVELPTIEEVVALPSPDRSRSLDAVVETILGKVTAVSDQVEPVETEIESDQAKSVEMSESVPATSNDSESEPILKVDSELLMPLAASGPVLSSSPSGPKPITGEEATKTGGNILDNEAAHDRSARGGAVASDRARSVRLTQPGGESKPTPPDITSNRSAPLTGSPVASSGDVAAPAGSSSRTGPMDPPAVESAPTRKYASGPETVQRESRRYEPVSDSGEHADTNGSRVRLESLAAARFASAAGRRYQQTDLETFSVIRGRGDSSRAGGIRAAQRGDTMKNSVQRNQIAESRVQNVPVVGRDGAPAPVTAGSVAENVRSGDAGHEGGSRFGVSVGDAVSMAASASRAAVSAQSTSEIQSVSNSAIKTSEQLVQHLTREVMHFKSFNAESMAVVLKPDKHTEIFLHLAMRNGGVEVHARFDRGDFASLNSQWSQLQQTMQQQGVKLSTLQESLEQQQQGSQLGDSAWGHGQNSRERDGDSLDETFIESLDEKLIFDSKKEPVNRPNQVRARDTRGSLEAWA